MKEPWEIYYDEFRRELKRMKKERSFGIEEAQKAELQVAEAVLYHLVEQLHWNRDVGVDFVEHLRSVPIAKPEGAEGTYRERLRGAWTEWNLARGRRRDI